ncbi:NAD-dependent epimerase/dehydratase family protein [uncultured Anaeromusa sp.]|uniref:NAD-dependent epimerase/dehydratase family protein n=1 Tax=uncultured Anaeromusa sp. TaxID=673273 RepID=UPI0029C817FA|nr:NAD-dependent epimerase/dehydratase family protein [uncultured Anaeromusa sp.]
MRCLILGGAGFLGSHLCDALTAAGYEITIFDRPGASLACHSGLTVREGDFSCLTEAQFAELLQGIDVVYHLVSTTVPSNEDLLLDVQTNVMPTLRLLEACKKQAVRVVFFSSGGTVYGKPRCIPIGEEHGTNPICSYGVQKLAIEKYLQLYQHAAGLEYIILRIANPYGVRQVPFTTQGVVATFLAKALLGEPLEVWGDGSVVRDYLYVGDVARAAALVLRYQGPERIFNIGSGCGHSLNELLQTLETAVGRTLEVRYRPGRKQDVSANVLDIVRAQAELNWQPQISLLAGVQAMRDSWQPATKRFEG